MRTLVITTVVLILTGVATARAQAKNVQYEVPDENFYCAGANGPEVCTPTLHLNDTIRLRICGAPVDVLSIKQQQRELPGYAVTKEVAEKMGIVGGGSKGFSAAPPEATPADDDTIAQGFNDVRSRVDAVVSDLRRTSAFVRYEGDHSGLRNAYQALLHAVPTNQLSTLTSRLQKQEVLNKIGMTAADVATYVQHVDALANASGKLECYAADTFEAEAPFDVEVEWTAANPLITPPPNTVIPFRFRAWRVSTTAGFAVSGLVDDHYTTKTVEVTPASEGKPAVTKKVAVQEERDVAAPEVMVFLHVGPPSVSWPQPRYFTFGAGLSTDNTNGRLYAGASWGLGNTAALTVGVAGGKVKRLSRNVPVDNLGDVDPEAARRDVFRTSWFVGFSWRVSEK